MAAAETRMRGGFGQGADTSALETSRGWNEGTFELSPADPDQKHLSAPPGSRHPDFLLVLTDAMF